jgi:hypothetical protein
MAKRPDDRYGGAAELADDLDDVLAGRRVGHATRIGAPAPGGTSAFDLDAFLGDLGGGEGLSCDGSGADRTGTVGVRAAPSTRRRIRRLWLASAATAAALFAGLLAGGAHRGPPAAEVPRAPRVPPPASAVMAVPETIVFAPRPKSWVMLDVKHSLRRARLKVWIDEALAVDAGLQAPVTKRIVAFAIREGRLARPLALEPGRRQIKVQIAWDEERRAASAAFEAKPDDTRILEVRLAGRAKELALDWK